MNEIENNAIQKTEEVTNESSKSRNMPKTQTRKSKANKSRIKRERLAELSRQRKHELMLKKEEWKAERAKKKQELKAEREKQKQARLEKRRLEKERRLKKHQANLAEKQAKKQELQALKLKKREERLKRHELLKHETKAARSERIAKERAQKLEMRRQKLEDKKAKRLELIKEREQKRLLRNQERREKRKNNKGVGGWLAAVISLGVTVLVLAGMLTFTLFTPVDDYMSSAYQAKNFYDLVGYVDNLDVNLSKLTVSTDGEDQQKLLGEVRVQSNLAVSSISAIALPDEDKFYTTKFINQVGDYAKYLNEKLIDGNSLTSEEKQTLTQMYEISNGLKNELSSLASQIDQNFDFCSLYQNKQDNLIISKFIELESNATNYPHLIYDGAFSEDAKVKQAKALVGLKEFSKMDAEKQLNQYFKDYNLKNIELVGEVTGSNVECYEFTATTEDGTNLTAEISKKGGKLLLFNHYKDCQDDKVSVQNCQVAAEEFLSNLGITDIRCVWKTTASNTVTFNYASVVDGVICYSDLIKINVCKERGTVSAIETSAYYLNHTKNRTLNSVTVTKEQALKKVGSNITVESTRLAIIPVGNNSEVLAYEFIGTHGDATYYIYVDASTGREVNVLKVVNTNNGSLIM